jgi:hypothetical protein
MALENYPLFEKWTTIQDWIMDVAEKYPKNARFTLANRTINHALDVQEKLIEAIYSKKRLALLYQINIYVEKIRVLLRIAWRRRFIGEKQFEFAAREINEFGSMIGGWIKKLKE